MVLRRTTILKLLQCVWCFLEIRTLFFEFSATDLGALVQKGILDCRRSGNGERLGQSQMFLSESIGQGVALGKAAPETQGQNCLIVTRDRPFRKTPR